MGGKSSAKPALSIFLISLLGFPATYFVNTAQSLHGEVGLLVSGVVSLAIICILTYFALSSFKQPKDWLFYVFALSTFSSCVDMIIGLETDGYITGFMTNYLKNGEPYLGTPYGAMICYWDGTIHYLLYVAMLVAVAYGYDFRDIGLYWVGSIGHSMLILVPGAILGHYGVRWSFLLNIPYIFIPLISGARFLSQKRKSSAKFDAKVTSVEIGQRPFDILLIVLLVASTAVAFFRGFAVVGGSPNILKQYVSRVEPYLEDPVVFPKIQMLVYMYYFVPFYVGAIYALLYPGNSWLRDWSFIFAGAAAQAQVPHIISSFHARTLSQYHVPDDARVLFWAVNLLLLVLPHILVLRCWLSPSFFAAARVDDAASAASTQSGVQLTRRRKDD